MAQNIYDENGRKVGEIKSDREKAEDDIAALSDNIGCLAILIVGILGFFIIAPWITGVGMFVFEGEVIYLYPMISIIIATILAGRKIVLADHSPWGAFWRVFLIDIIVGAPGGILAVLVDVGYWDNEEILGGVPVVLWYAILPAAIVAWIVRRKKRK